MYFSHDISILAMPYRRLGGNSNALRSGGATSTHETHTDALRCLLTFAGRMEWRAIAGSIRVRQRTQELDCEHIERDINALRRALAEAHSRTRQLIEKIEYGYGACQNETTTPLLKG